MDSQVQNAKNLEKTEAELESQLKVTEVVSLAKANADLEKEDPDDEEGKKILREHELGGEG